MYEIEPLAGNGEGGLARVAGLRRELQRENPNTFVLFSGDLFSPSAMGSIKVDGERLAGRQIVDVMNRVGVDYATFGNHEFDYDRATFDRRLGETRFPWVSANVTYLDGTPFPGVPAHAVFDARNAAGERVRVGVFGVTLATPGSTYVRYRPPVAAAREAVDALRGEVDVLLALTHLSIADDHALAEQVRGIDLVLGGHEHENNQVHRGPSMTPIYKADANARTVYVHRLAFDVRERRLRVRSELRRIDATVPADPAIERVARAWHDRAFDALRAQGFAPDEHVGVLPVPLDGTEASVRNGATTLTDLLGDALLDAVPDADVALYNSGSVRIDDVLAPGPVTQYDAFRVLPFGGRLVLVAMSGAELARVRAIGDENIGSGGYLQVRRRASTPERLDPARSYRVVLNDFLLTGRETKLERMKEDAGHLAVVRRDAGDFQKVLIDKLRRTYPAS